MTPEESFQRRLLALSCKALRCQEHWEGSELRSAAGVVFMQVHAQAWIRFFFEAGSFFWSVVPRPDDEHEDGDHRYCLSQPPEVALLSDCKVAKVSFVGADGDALREVQVAFDNGISLFVRCEPGRSSCVIGATVG